MEHNPETNRDEQYPLLKVENVDGSGDKPRPQPLPTIVRPSWNVTCTPKQSWFQRWPEFMSACWMTLILLAISFLVFYALGISTYRRQPIIVFRCNNSKPASDVYFHYISSRSNNILPRYSEFLSNVAIQYPYLRFNVYFLMEDSQTTSQSVNHTRFFKQLVPSFPKTINAIIDQNNKREIMDFQRRYQNINITLMPLKQYMAKTPLRYVWRTLQVNYLPFYARIFSVWQTGGIGFDLATFNHIYNSRQGISNKLKAILKQHNDGIETEKYVNILNSMDVEDENKIFSSILNMINLVLNQTSLFFNTDVAPEAKMVENTPLVRTHRSKRDLEYQAKSIDTSISPNSVSNDTYEPEMVKNITRHNINATNSPSTEMAIENNATDTTLPSSVKVLPKSNDNLDKKPEVLSDFPEMSIFYYFSVFDDIGPFYSLPLIPIKSDAARDVPPMKITEFKKLTKHGKQAANHLSISSDGMFVAAPLRNHPFLAHLLSNGCKRVNPRIAIDDTYMNQCSVFIRDDVYCDNIHIINSIF